MGAFDYVTKPFKVDELLITVQRALEYSTAVKENVDLKAKLEARYRFENIVAESPAMRKVCEMIERVAHTDATVLIIGESGTGKELVAKAIHAHSKRKKNKFVPINCAALPEPLLESELFGHVKGAFTGATANKEGLFEVASGGTLLLDEIGSMPLSIQGKLLRALQEQVVEPVGSNTAVPVNARIIAATHRDLFETAREGQFREDLAYRLDVVHIHLPPLRERRDDIPLLVDALLARAAGKMERPAPPVDPEALELLRQHDWPGNVRELENVLTQALVQAREGTITDDLIRFHAPQDSPSAHPPTKQDDVLLTLEEVEARHIQKVLWHTGGHKGNSCRILGISRPALDRKIKKYGLSLGEKI